MNRPSRFVIKILKAYRWLKYDHWISFDLGAYEIGLEMALGGSFTLFAATYDFWESERIKHRTTAIQICWFRIYIDRYLRRKGVKNDL